MPRQAESSVQKKDVKGVKGKKWKTGLVAPSSHEFLMELSKKYGDPRNPHSDFLKQRATRTSGPWIGGTDSAEVRDLF